MGVLIDASVLIDAERGRVDLAASGSRIGPGDLWLAAAALAHGLTLVTAHLRAFDQVPGSRVERWGAERHAQP